MRRCICYIDFQQHNQTEYIELPLEKVNYFVEITDCIAETTMTQNYINNSQEFQEIVYQFPLSNDVCITQLVCELDGKRIQGIVKEKQEAKKEYELNTQQGNTAIYSEKNERTPDIMKIQLGKIPPNSNLSIKLTYVEELSIQQNKFYQYKIHQTLTPRYQDASDQHLPPVIEQQSKQKPLFFTTKTETSIDFRINSQYKIDTFHSSSHDVVIQSQNDQKTFISGRVDDSNEQNTEKLRNKNFILLFRNEMISLPKAILGENKDKTQVCAQITFVPDFNNAELDDALKSQIKAQQLSEQAENANTDEDIGNFPVDMNSARSEFIFLLDRSGSMSGNRIKKAKEALILFLMSLPPGSYFNVYSFGSHYDSLFPSSKLYEQSTVEKAISQIEQFSASYGGTDLAEPLLEICKLPDLKNYPRQIFLLTDGCVSNPDRVINQISFFNKKVRVHSIGVGSGVSSYLVNETAKQGRGKAIFVDDNVDINGPVISLLDAAMTPVLDQFEIKYDKAVVERVIPCTENMPAILKNEPFNMFVFFKKGIKKEEIDSLISLSCFDSKLNENLQYSVQISGKSDVSNNAVFQLGTHKIIQDLEKSIYLSEYNFASGEFAKNAEQELVKISIESQILSKQTAYICVISDALSDEKKIELLSKDEKKIIIPQILSSDYQGQENYGNSSAKNIKYRKSSFMSAPIRQSVCRSRGSRGGAIQQSYGREMDLCSIQSPQMFTKQCSNLRSKEKRKVQYQQQQQQQYLMEECLDDAFDNDMEIEQTQKKEKEENKINFNKINNSDLLLNVIKKQNLTGFWTLDEQMCQIICKKSVKEIEILIPQQILKNLEDQNKSIIEQYWMTLLVVAWLEKYHQNSQSSWVLIQRKAVGWMNRFNLKYESIIDIARNQI